MRSLFSMTVAIVLAAGVSAKADVIKTFDVSRIFTGSSISSAVVLDTTSGVAESALAFASLVDVVGPASQDAAVGVACLLADLCDGSVGAYDTNSSSTPPLQTEGATRSAEPSSVALLGTGLLGFAAVMRRRFVA
jgi:hypothetical protein